MRSSSQFQLSNLPNHYRTYLASTNPQYEDRLFIELPIEYMKIPSSEHDVYINCSECQNEKKKQFVYTTCSELGIFMYSTGN